MNLEDKKILNKIKRSMARTSEWIEDVSAYRDIYEMNWDYPSSWNPEGYVRKRVSSVGHTGLKTVVNMFNTYEPKWEILPQGPADKDKAESLERWLEWQMHMANIKGAKQPFKEILKDAAQFGKDTYQLDYLPYWDSDPKLRMNGSFCIKRHEPDTVYYDFGDYELRWVAVASNVPASFILDTWEGYEEGDKDVKSALRKIRDTDKDEEEDTQYIYVDYVDKKRRWVFCFESEGDTCTEKDLDISENADVITIVDKENDLGFINWAITESSGDPLFKAMYKSGSWENDCFLKTLEDSTVMRRAYFPILSHTSPTGEPLDVNFSGPEAVVENKAGEVTQVLVPPPLDPGIRELRMTNEATLSQELGVRGLQNTDVTGNVQFATVNAQIQLGKTVMEPHLRCAERTMSQLARLAFKWVEKRDDTVTGYRRKDKGGEGRGEKINVSPKDFDSQVMFINCEILANTPTDDMQRWNIFAGMLQAGLPVPMSEFIERMEMGNPETQTDKWLDDKALQLALKLLEAKKLGELQVEIQQKMAAASAPQGPVPPDGKAPPPQGMNQPAFDNTQGQGFNPNGGGSSPMEAAPQMTQTVTR